MRVYFSKTQGAFCKTAETDRFLVQLTSGWFVSGRPMEIARPRRGEEREEEGRLGWALGLVFSIYYPFSISYFKPNSTYLNSNLNLNSTLALKQIKQCTSKNATTGLNLEIFLITCERKIKFKCKAKHINLRKLNNAN